jgi:RND family efflux transporter MFP subunit
MTVIEPFRHRHVRQTARALSAVAVLSFAAAAWAHSGHGTQEVGVYDLDAPRKVSSQTAKHIGLKSAEVQIRPIQEVVTLSGTVKPRPDRQHAVVSLLEGQVTQVHVRVGDRVETGQALIEIKSLPFLERWSKLRMFEAKIEALGSQYDAAKEQLERTERLAGQAIPERELILRKAELAKVESDLELQRIEAQQAKAWLRAVVPDLDLGEKPRQEFTLRAAIDGYVVKRLVAPGEWAQPGQVLVEVADYGQVQIEGELPESLIASVRRRQSDKVRIRVPADPDFLAVGTVRFLAPELEPVKRTAHLIIDVDNPDGVLRGEMWVDLAIVLREVRQALVVPRKAVVVQGPLHFVFIKTGGQYVKQDIVPGVTDDQYVEVRDGLVPGDEVVVQGAYSLTHLKPKAAAAPATPAPEKAEPKEEEPGHNDDGHTH